MNILFKRGRKWCHKKYTSQIMGEIAKRNNSLLGRLEEAFKKEMSFKVGFERW